MDRIRVYTGGVASCNGYLFKTRDNTYVAVDAPSGFADWIYSKKPDIIITDLLITHQHFDHVEDACRMRQIFDCRIHAGQPYNESLTLEKMARDAWGLPLNVQPFVVDEILTPDIHTANWGGLLWHLHQVPGHSPDSIVYDLPDEAQPARHDYDFPRTRALYHRKERTADQSVHLLTAVPAPLCGIVFYSLASIQDQCYFQN